MNYILKLLALAIAYSLSLLFGMVTLCGYSFYRCEYSGELNLTVWVIPAVIVFCVLMVAGMCVAYINLSIDLYMRSVVPSSLMRFMLGAASGVLPLFLWNIVTGRFPDIFFPDLQYVPFLIGGIVVASSIAFINKKQMKIPKK